MTDRDAAGSTGPTTPSRRREAGVTACEARHIPFVFRIDIEPDRPLADRFRPSPWNGFERAVRLIRSFRERAAAATGSPAHFVWLLRMDPQIGETYGALHWAAERYSSHLSAAAAHGDEIGLHVHVFRWTQQQRWCTDLGNQDWVDHCVRVSFDAFRRTFGRKCEVLAFGNRWLNDATVRLIEQMGNKFELTVEPGHPARSRARYEGLLTDDLPTYAHAPRYPYRPASHDFRADDPLRREGMWMLPLTTAALPRDPLRRLYDAARRVPPGTKGHVTLNPSLPPASFRAIFDVALRRPETSFLTMVARSEVFLGHLGDNVQANLDWFLQRSDVERFAFSTPARVLAALGLEADRTPAISAR